jgi:hypothetical protein
LSELFDEIAGEPVQVAGAEKKFSAIPLAKGEKGFFRGTFKTGTAK